MSFDYIISEICNLRIGEAILIGDNTTLLDYGHQFIGMLYVVDSRPQTHHLVSHRIIHRVLECS